MSLAAIPLKPTSTITEEQGAISRTLSSDSSINKFAWNYGHTHPIIPPHASPEVEVERRLSTLSCSPFSFQKKKPKDVSRDRLPLNDLPEEDAQLNSPSSSLNEQRELIEILTTSEKTDAVTATIEMEDAPRALPSGNFAEFNESFAVSPVPVQVQNGSGAEGGLLNSNSQDDEKMHLSRENIRLATQVKLLMASSEDALREKVELQTRLRSVEAQNSAISASLQSLIEARQVAISELGTSKSAHTFVVQKLEETERRLSKRDTEYAVQQTRTETLQKNVELLRGQLSVQKVDEEEKTGVIQALKAKISSQQMDIERLQQEKERQTLSKKVMDKKQLAAEELEREQLVQELTRVKKDYQQAQEDVRKLVDQSMTQKLQYDALRRENSKLSQDIVDLQHTAVKDKTGFLKQLEKVEAEQRQREAELLRSSEKSSTTKKEGNGVRVINENEWSRLAQLLSRSDGLEVELTATKTEAQDIRQRLLMVEEDRKDLLRRVVVAEKSVEERDATIEFLNRRLDSATQRLNDTNIQLTQMQQTSRQHSAALLNLDSLSAEKDSLLHERTNLQSTVSSLRKQLNGSQQDAATLRKEIQELKSANKSLSGNLAVSQQEKTAKETHVNTLSNDYRSLTEKYNEVAQQLVQNEASLQELKRFKESLQNTEVELTAWKEAATAWQTYSEHLSVKPATTTSETQSDAVEDEQSFELQGKLLELEASMLDLQTAHQQVTEELVKAEGRIHELDGQCVAYNEACQRLQAEVDHVREENDRYAELLQLEQGQHSQLRSQLENADGFRQERDALQGRCDTLVSEISQLKAEMAKVEGDNAGLSEERNVETQTMRQQLIQQEAEHQATVASFEATTAEMNQAVAQHDEQWKEFLRSQTATLEEERFALQQEVARLSGIIEELSRQQQQQEAVRKESDAGELVRAETQKTEVAQALQERCNALTSQVAQLTDTITKMESELTKVPKEKDDELQNLKERLSQQVEEPRTTVATLEATIAEMNEAVVQHDGQWKEFLQSQTSYLEAEKITLQQNIDQLTVAVEDLKKQQQESELQEEVHRYSVHATQILEDQCSALAFRADHLSEEMMKAQIERAQLIEKYDQEAQKQQQTASQQEESHRAVVAAFEATIAEMNQAVAQHDEQWKEYLQSQTKELEEQKSALQQQVTTSISVIEDLKRQQEERQSWNDWNDDDVAPKAPVQNVEFSRELQERCSLLSLQVSQLTEEIAKMEEEKTQLTAENIRTSYALNEVRSHLEQMSHQASELKRLEADFVEKHNGDAETWSLEVERLRQLLTQQEEGHQASVAAFEASIAEMGQAVAQHDEEWKRYLHSQTAVLEGEKTVLQEEIHRLNTSIDDLQKLQETPQAQRASAVEHPSNGGETDQLEADPAKQESAEYVEPIMQQRILLEKELQNLSSEKAVPNRDGDWQQRLEEQQQQWHNQLASLTYQADDTKARLESAVSENAGLTAQMEELQAALRSREEELQVVNGHLLHTVALDRFEEVTQEKQSLSEACFALQEQVDTLRQELEAFHSAQNNAMTEPQVTGGELHLTLSTLEDQIESLRSTKSGLEEKILSLEAEVSRVNTQSSVTLQQTVTEYEERVVAFNQEWQAYVGQQSATFEEEKLSLTSQITSLSEELKQTQSLLERIAIDRSTLPMHIMSAEAPDKMKAHCTMCDSLVRKVHEHQEAIDTLHLQIQQYEQENHRLDRGPAERMALDGAAEISLVFGAMVQQADFGGGDTEIHLDDFPLGDAFEPAEPLDVSGTTESEVVQDLKEDRMRLQVELLAVQEECERLQEQLASIQRSPRHSPRRSSMSSLRTLADFAGQVLDDFEIPDDKEDNDEDFIATVHLQDLIVSLQAHVKDLTMEVEDATTRNSRLTEELSNAHEKVKASEARCFSYGVEYEKERGVTEVLQHELGRLKEEVSTLTAHLADKEVHVAALKQEVVQQQRLVDQTRTTTQNDALSLSRNIQGAEDQRRVASLKLHEANEEIGMLRQELERHLVQQRELEGALQRLRASLVEKGQENEMLGEKLQKSQDELEKSVGALANVEAEKNQLSKNVQRLRTKVSELSNEIKELKEEVERRQSTHDSFRERVSHEAETLDLEIQSLREHLQIRDSEYDDLDRQMKEMRDEGRSLKTELKVTKKQLRDTARQLRQSEQELMSDGGRKSSHTSSMNGDTTLSQSSQKAKLKLLDILQSSSDNIPRASNTLKICMDSLKSEIDDLKSQMDLHIQVVKSKSDLS